MNQYGNSGKTKQKQIRKSSIESCKLGKSDSTYKYRKSLKF